MEARIVEAARAGDRDALAAIVDDLTPTVLGAAYGLCGDWHIAGDIAQEAFATMLVRLHDLREPAALPGWMLAVVRTAARRERRRPPVPRRSVEDPGPEDVVVARDEAERVRRAVEGLAPEIRLPTVLHYFAGCPLAEIADLCELPLSTVKKRMRVARARLREEIDMTDVACSVQPNAGEDPTDVIRMYVAMRSGDRDRVAAILDARPDLVDVRESWTRAESFAHRLPWTQGGGTPLLRAVERGDAAMVELLLERGADPNGACTCAGGESPLWVAAVQREERIVDLLLEHGAHPDARAFEGTSALAIARMRGYDAIAARLVAAGATPELDPPVGGVVEQHAQATGIKAIDLWCPLPDRGVAHLTPGFGLGAIVLVAELSHRAARLGRRVVWTGFVQAPTDLGDVHHALAESDIVDCVTVSMASPSAPRDEQVAALDRGIAVADDDGFLVVFAETGWSSAVEERLPQLARRAGRTLVVAPLDGSVAPPKPEGSPYLASIVFDVDRARRHRWPAIGKESWSKVADAEGADLATRARADTSDALDAYLAQPFFVAEPVMGRAGESVSLDELRSTVERLLTAGTVGVAE